MSSKKSDKKSSQHYMMAFLGVGISVSVEIAVSMGIGWWIGKWVDARWGTAPYGMSAGVILFLAASLTHALVVLNHLNKRMNKEEDNV
jgi:F0F1-type ATP synthase assembly protein I